MTNRERHSHHRRAIITGMGRWARAGVGIGLGSVAVPLGIGWFYTRVLLDTSVRPMYPEKIVDSDADTVTLAAGRLARQPGTWGLRWPEGVALVGPVVEADRARVVRPLLAGPRPPAGTRAVLDAAAYDPDPSALGLEFVDVDIAAPLGACPAWFVPAGGDTWAVLVHGRGGTRREGLRLLPALHALDLPTLVLSYRNDPEAPASPDGHHHLGDTEWLDVEAALHHALANGARRLVLVGWSMGAAITGALLDRSPLAPRVAAVVWDAPMLDWRATLRQQARIRRIPPALTGLTTGFTRRRIGIDFDRFDLRRRPPAVRPPTLMIHSAGDTAVPAQPARALAAVAPALGWPMTYLEVPEAEHTAAWNADPVAYEDTLTRFLRGVLP
jgi:alpha-beta hydrolase superfamily lysophospholipase